MVQSPFQPLTSELVAGLASIVGSDHVSTTQADRAQHARDMSGHTPHLAEAVVWPGSAAEVAAVLRLANENRVPVTPWGAGTSLEGNPIPVRGGISLSTRRMNRILAVHAGDFQVTTEPGIGYKDLNEALARHGLFFPPDPGANAAIGGMLANNAAGIRSVKYGACKENVLRLEVALPDGRLIRCGSRSVKQSSGYDLLHLIIGSEGTLGVITEATLKLAPIPEHVSAVVAGFPTVESAVEAVVAVRGSGLEPAALEFIDANHARMIGREEGVNLGERPTLFMEFHAADRPSLQTGLDLVREICEELGASTFLATADPEQRRRLWKGRHHAYETAQRNHPGEELITLDVAVPISRYPALVAHVQEVLADHDSVGYLIGHAGDGNLHVLLPFDDDSSYRQAMVINEVIVLKAIELEGTATGEHGVGLGKVDFMAREHGAALEVMRSVKQLLDPRGIMNPGKIFAGDRSTA